MIILSLIFLYNGLSYIMQLEIWYREMFLESSYAINKENKTETFNWIKIRKLKKNTSLSFQYWHSKYA